MWTHVFELPHRFLQVCIRLFLGLWDKRTILKWRTERSQKDTNVHLQQNLQAPTHSLRSHCSMRRWQYWNAFSLRRSFGGSTRLEEEVAETMETTEPSTSDRSSAAGGDGGWKVWTREEDSEGRYVRSRPCCTRLSKWWEMWLNPQNKNRINRERESKCFSKRRLWLKLLYGGIVIIFGQRM